jgi:soluble lytic murein transglycosylase-like protein
MIPIKQTQQFLINKNKSANFNTLATQINNAKDKESALKACKEFEAMFVKQMLQSMTKTLENKSLIGTQPGSDFYQDIYLNDIAMKIADTGQIGLSKQIMRQLEFDENSEIETKSLDHYYKKTINSAKTNNNAIGQTLQKRLEQLESIINKASKLYGVNPKMIKAIIAQESYANPKAVSSVGAKGLMQLMDITADSLGVKNSFDPEENIMAGTRYFKMMREKFGSDELALAAYNAGPSNIAKYKGIPPFKETKTYINRVLTYYKNIK